MAQLKKSIDIDTEIIDVYTITFSHPTWFSKTETFTIYHYKFSNLYTFDFKEFYISFEELAQHYPIHSQPHNHHYSKIIDLWNNME